MISRQDIINKTCYGLNLYSHVIRLEHEPEAGLRVSFPDCGLWPNPFDEYRRSLHITVVKQNPEQKLSYYIALHHDESGHIPDGNAIDFAGLYFNLQNQELLEKINKDLYLHIGEKFNPYERKKVQPVEDLPEDLPEAPKPVQRTNPGTTPEPSANKPSVITEEAAIVTQPQLFSYYRRPVYNKAPHSEITLLQAYKYIISDRAKETTARLRSIKNVDAAKKYKSNNFDYITPGGTFTSRKAEFLKAASGLIVIDIDDIELPEQVEATFNLLLTIPRLETQLLFRSPSGHGLKWIIQVVNNEGHTHEYFFNGVSNYLKTFGIIADPSGKDICRACFLPHDPNAFINQKYL